MRAETVILVCMEWVAFTAWLVNYHKLNERKYRLFALYLGVIAIAELLNLIFNNGNTKWSNILIVSIITPLEFLFLINFLLYGLSKLSTRISILFSGIYLLTFMLEKLDYFMPPTYFNSFSSGTGALLLLAAVIITIRQVFKSGNHIYYQRNSLFWIVMGIILFYTGNLPYDNFRNFFWSKPAYYQMAYFLHYLSHVLCIVMYLLFAYSVKWKTK